MLHAEAGARHLALVRIAVFAIWLLRILPDCFSCYADFDASLFGRLGVLRLIPRDVAGWLLDPRLLAAGKIILVALISAAALGVAFYRVFAVSAAVLLTIYEGIPRGLAQQTHVDLPLLWMVYLLAVSPAADAFAWRTPRSTQQPQQLYASAMIMMALVFLSTYCLTACHRLVQASPEIFFTSSIRQFVASDILRPTHNPFLLGEWLLESPFALSLFQVGFVVVTLFELLSPLCLICRPLRYTWIVAMISFHAGAYVFMNVLFMSNALLIPVLLLESEPWLRRVSSRNREATCATA
ncbi:MAG TPA: hypothetical protein VMT89_03095 [Candidatus Acidoferrales bacterium]|nr:hypothetical protein [Candidatus Acidoferrales bacterium]